MIILGGYFGVRTGQCELFQLTWEDIDLERRLLRIDGSHKNESAPWRKVPIRQSLIPLFKQWQVEDLAGAQHLINSNGSR